VVVVCHAPAVFVLTSILITHLSSAPPATAGSGAAGDHCGPESGVTAAVALGTVRFVEQIPQYADERLTAEWDGRCLYCGYGFGEARRRSVDHVPSKTLLQQPYPENLPTVPACVECNSGFSGDEQYVQVFIGCALSGSVEPSAQFDAKVRAALLRSTALRTRIESSMRKPSSEGGPVRWEPEHERLATVLVKNARGHLWHEHADRRRGEPTVVYSALESLACEQRELFENPPEVGAALPEVGSRALQRRFSGDWLDGWTFVQDDRYRFAVDYLEGDTVRVRMVIAEYLAVAVVWRE